MKCNLQIDKNGELKVGGVNAPLFREAMLRTNQNEEASLKIWAVAESEGFKEFNVPPTYDNVIKYNEYRERIDSTPFNSTELSDSMNASIGNVFFQEDFMKSFTNEKGEFEISSDRLKKVGLYSSSEIYNLLSDEKVQRNVKKFYNKSLNFEAPITTSEAKYIVKSDNEISSLGFFKRENPDVVNETLGNIFAGVKNKEDFDNRKMKVDEQWEAVKYEDISNDFSDKTSIAQYVENPLTNELELKSYNNTYYETLFGTEIGENNEKAVEIIDLITSLTPEQLSDTNEIKHAFNTLSKELVKSGIDFVGIENQYGEIPSPKIIELLLHTKNILTNEAISEEGLQNYVDVYNEVFEKNQNTKKSLFDGIITNSMKIEKKNISDASLFINNSLVKIKENIYKKVNRNYEDVYEAVYNLMKNGGKQVIPFDVSKAERALYKEKVIRELREFASKKSQGIRNDVEATNEELDEMSLLSEYFKEEEQIVNPKVEWIKFERLSKIKDVESWKSRFVQRMNKEMISQKMKGNMLPLTITQRGLEMTTDGDYSLSLIKNSISNSLYSDLIDYGLLTNQDFLATEEGIFIDEGNVDFQRNLYANNPNLISEYNGAVEYGQGTDLKAVGDTFIKVGGIVYEKVNGNVYGLVSNQGEQTWNRQIPKVFTKPSENKVLGKKTIKQTTNFNVNVEERNPNTNEIENIEIKYEGNERRRDRTRWDSRRGNQTLEGSPIVEGATGADPELTSIAEEYALSEGIDYRRQSEYVKVDVDRAKRIAQAYEDMKHEPQNPKVKEAYQNLISQTLKQYNFLVNAGYKFYLMDETNDPYGGNPWNAMRDLRNNKTMGVFATEAGFGSGATELDVSDNPMLEDMKITWGYGSVDGEQKRVLANDLFRAVHYAFGHGLEGAGFRARGEENAWQAHARLFTGSALSAITSETRGQNSWLNYGKFGEQNRTAKVEDTVFADQKTGLMPEWTWKEGFNEGISNISTETTNDKALSEGVNEVQKIAEEYKIANDIVGVQHSKVTKLFPNVSKMISEAYEQADEYSDSKEVTESYKALEEDTIKQYEFIVSKGLSVSRWKGSGEPYPNSKSMLKDVRENNHLYFLPNSEAFGKEEDSTEERLGLKPTDIYLDDGYRMTLSEVFRVVHDYFGHGILGNQFGAVGEENATLQHLDLYSEKALPAVVFQTRGQNSWVNFSRVNDEALRKMKEGRETSNEELLKQGQDEFKFATPKDNILPKIFNFKTYETARRINEQEEIRKSETYLDPRGKYEDSFISDSLSRYTENSSGKLNGFSRRSLGVSKRLGRYDVDVIAEYEGNKEVERLIKNVFPQFKGTQKIYEISNGDVYREMMIEVLETNKFKSSVTVHSAEDFSNMRLFVTEDGSTGITLTKDGFLGGAFGNPKADRPNNLAQMMLLGIKEGAITAEAFDTVLPNYYSMFGFKAVSRTAFNEEYRPLKVNGALEDWDYDTYYKFNKGKPDVVFFIYDGGSRETIQERIGQFDSYSRYQKDFTESYDKESYDEAYRFMEVEAVNKSLYETPTIVETTKESEIFKTLSSIPLLSEDEALKAYKNIYSNKMFDWKNQEC